MKVTGFSHITINIRNLQTSLDFYHGILGMTIRHRGRTDAYLEWGSAWVCLVERMDVEENTGGFAGMDHVAFYIAENDFNEAVGILKQSNVTIVRGPIQRGVGWSVNFLDPDGIQLELHTSTLDERMEIWR
ncbi:glutathione transferase [Paenibacillus sp. IHB B 3415]|uniref:VOC family protein n=1 Tax=Paenibacillus sp. IHB B 3415 TaxID=867080 RepID=UPI000575AD32|nr:VOC family protein [Paenibacillus sp. IHB B 3415]KHL96847.1 glutathione transferase [Paenibacillus sp. IHB B 3415]